MNSSSKFLLLSAFLAATGSLSAQVTGFNGTGAGPYDYLDGENWVNEDINGIWDSSLTITSEQTAMFGEDTILTTGWSFLYTGNFDVTLRGQGGDRAVTLGGDIFVSPVSNRTISIGSNAADQALNIDLGGNRVFTVASSKTLAIWNTISGGDLIISGTSPSGGGGTVRFNRATGNAANSHITVRQNATLQFDNSTNGNVGAVRAESVTLVSGGKLSVRGNNVNTVETITGALVTDGGGARPAWSGNNYHSVTLDAGSANTLLTIGSLERKNKGTLLVRGDNLGVNPIASAVGGSSNIQILGSAPEMIGGGGAAGTTNISIIPWLVGGLTISDSGSTFVTYTAENGLRPLSYTEFANSFDGDPTNNVRITATSDTVIDGNATVNSLILAGAGGSISGTGTLTVTSGAVLFTRTTGSNSDINVNLDFGSSEGIIGYLRGNMINGAIAGTGGLTIHGNRNDENLVFNNGASTYTGDTTILASVMVVSGFLPHGDRTGDVYVYGNLRLNAGGYNGTINGLWGNGVVTYGNSGKSSLEIGDNDATSTFEGSINTNNNFTLKKIGAGTLTLSGNNSVQGTMEVNAGTLLINGTLGGGGAVQVNAGTLGGAGDGVMTGVIVGTTTLAAGAKLSPGTMEGGAGNLTFLNGLNLSASSNDTGAYVFNLNGVESSDRITLTSLSEGALNVGVLDAEDFTFVLGAGFGAGIYVLFDASSTIAGSIGNAFVDFGGGITGTLSIDTVNHDVLLTVVPEPSAAMLAVLGLAGLGAFRRRR